MRSNCGYKEVQEDSQEVYVYVDFLRIVKDVAEGKVEDERLKPYRQVRS